MSSELSSVKKKKSLELNRFFLLSRMDTYSLMQQAMQFLKVSDFFPHLFLNTQW